MKKSLFALLCAALFASQPASANVVATVHETLASGATFDGTLTFADNYGALLDVDGTLSGGPYATTHFGWTWWAGHGNGPFDEDGNAASYEDWLMDGDNTNYYQYYLGVSWLHDRSSLTLLLPPQTGSDYASLNYQDAVTSVQVGNPLPEPGSLALLGMGVLGLALARARRRS